MYRYSSHETLQARFLESNKSFASEHTQRHTQHAGMNNKKKNISHDERENQTHYVSSEPITTNMLQVFFCVKQFLVETDLVSINFKQWEIYQLKYKAQKCSSSQFCSNYYKNNGYSFKPRSHMKLKSAAAVKLASFLRSSTDCRYC